MRSGRNNGPSRSALTIDDLSAIHMDDLDFFDADFFLGHFRAFLPGFGQTDGDGLFTTGHFFTAAPAFKRSCLLFFHGAFDFFAGAFGVFGHNLVVFSFFINRCAAPDQVSFVAMGIRYGINCGKSYARGLEMGWAELGLAQTVGWHGILSYMVLFYYQHFFIVTI